MPSSRDSTTARICLICGDKGETKRLIYCRKCQDPTVHNYCLGSYSPKDDNINWCCWDCAPSKAESLRKSERINLKKQKVLTTRNYWKDKLKLNENKRPDQVVNGINRTGQSTMTFHLPIWNMETQLLNERQIEDFPEDKKAIDEIPRKFEEQNESVEIDQQTQKIQEIRKKKRTLVLNESDDSQDDGKTIELQLPASLANDDCVTLKTLSGQPTLEQNCSFLCAEPVSDPIWRGRFNVKEETEIGIGILAHLSNKACSKVSTAATVIPHILDIQIVEKHVVWPKRFRVSPPTAASIALYFFPACERDERAFDSLLDEVIEKDLALKAMINDVELLIFSSCVLPLEHWRYKLKYFLWGVFRHKQHAHSSRDTATSNQCNNSTNYSRLSQPTLAANNMDITNSESLDHSSSPSELNQSPFSRNSSQASNMLNQACDGDSRREEEKVGCFVVETEKCYKSCDELYLRLNRENGSAAEVV